MSQHAPQSPREYLSALVGLIPRALRAAWVGGVVFVLGLGATAAWTLSAPRLYRSEAVVVYERGVRAGTVGSTMEGDSVKEVGARVHDMLMSRLRLENAINELKLYPKVVDHRGMGEAVEEMRKHLAIPSRDGFTYRITYDADGRESAQHVLDWMLKGLIADDAQKRMRESEDTKRFLDAERAHADEELKKREAALAAFLAQHPQLAAETGGNGAATGGLIRAAERERTPAGAGGDVAALELQAAQIEEALAEAGARPAPSAPGLPATDPTLTAARSRAHAELQAMQRELADKQAHFTNEHPDVKALLRRIATAEAALHRADAALEAHHAAAPAAGPAPEAPAGDDTSASSRVTALRHALAAVRSQISSVKSRGAPRATVPQTVSSVVAIDTEWTRLNREMSEAREQQTQLEAKQFQAQLTATLVGGGQGGRLVVVEPPFKPARPITGGRLKLVVVGAIASLMLSLAAIVIMAAFDDRLYDPRDVQRIVKEGIVVVVPRLTGKSG
jgi:hypothetical protein